MEVILTDSRLYSLPTLVVVNPKQSSKVRCPYVVNHIRRNNQWLQGLQVRKQALVFLEESLIGP